MLKFKIAGEPADQTVNLKLERNGDAIAVVLVDENGKTLPRPYVARFLPDGRLLLPNGVNPDVGFQLNPKGQIVTSDE